VLIFLDSANIEEIQQANDWGGSLTRKYFISIFPVIPFC
jgi:hypothetical protein